jgi:hypothetical protein
MVSICPHEPVAIPEERINKITQNATQIEKIRDKNNIPIHPFLSCNIDGIMENYNRQVIYFFRSFFGIFGRGNL